MSFLLKGRISSSQEFFVLRAQSRLLMVKTPTVRINTATCMAVMGLWFWSRGPGSTATAWHSISRCRASWPSGVRRGSRGHCWHDSVFQSHNRLQRTLVSLPKPNPRRQPAQMSRGGGGERTAPPKLPHFMKCEDNDSLVWCWGLWTETLEDVDDVLEPDLMTPGLREAMTHHDTFSVTPYTPLLWRICRPPLGQHSSFPLFLFHGSWDLILLRKLLSGPP